MHRNIILNKLLISIYYLLDYINMDMILSNILNINNSFIHNYLHINTDHDILILIIGIIIHILKRIH